MKSILHVTPTYYSENSVVGGGERFCLNILKACSEFAAERNGITGRASILSFGERSSKFGETIVVRGDPRDVGSLNIPAIKQAIRNYDVIHVHQCLTAFGLFIASLGALNGKLVLGTDHGGGEYHMVNQFSHFADVFDGFVAQSDFAASAFFDFLAPVRVIRGPADESIAMKDKTPDSPFSGNDIVAVGRIEPHKGFERIIDCIDARGPSLAIIGRPYNEDYLNYLQNKAHGKPVTFHFDMDDAQVTDAIANSKMVVHASLNRDYRQQIHYKPELLGIVPLEALLQGTRVAVSDAGALDELAAVDGCMAFDSVDELRYFIKKNIAASEPDEQRRAEIRESCIEVYGSRQFAQSYFCFIDELSA